MLTNLESKLIDFAFNNYYLANSLGGGGGGGGVQLS